MRKPKPPPPFETYVWSIGADGASIYLANRLDFPYTDDVLRKMRFHATAEDAIEALRVTRYITTETLCDHLRVLHGVDVA